MIRPACFLDILTIVSLGNRYVEEEVKVIGHHSAKWDADLAAHSLAVTLSKPDELFLQVAVKGGQVVGFLWGGKHACAPWDNTLVASDYLFYLTPEARGSRLGYALAKEWKSWAIRQGCREVRLSIASGINEVRTGKMFKLLGFDHFGTVYNHKVEET